MIENISPPVSTNYDVLNQNCPSRRALSLIADKWTMLVLYALLRGTKRYGELQRIIQGVSKKMLTQTLRDLEANGLLQRKVFATVPPIVEYSLTPLGESLSPLAQALSSWAQVNIEAVDAARAQYQEQESDPLEEE
jgi:DNA-binding HxlR family transcriptional regulator